MNPLPEKKKRTISVTRIHGFWIRSRSKTRRSGKKAVTVRFVIVGPIPAKKNNQKPIIRTDRADRFIDQCFEQQGYITKSQAHAAVKMGQPIIVPSTRFEKWHKATAMVIEEQMKAVYPALQRRGLIFPISDCSLAVYHYWKQNTGKMTIRDLSNRIESIQDLFVDCHVILDDSDNILAPIQSDAERLTPAEIVTHTTVISLTCYY